MSDTSPTNSQCDLGCCPLPIGSEATVWEALANDTGAFVLLIDEDGTVICCNDLVNNQVGAEHSPLEGKNMSMFCAPAVVDECLSLIKRSINDQCMINMVGMCHGVATRSVARPLRVEIGGKRCVLKIVRPLNTFDIDAMLEGHGVWVKAKSFDLGSLSELTTRELEVLRLIGESMTTAEIAEHMHRSVKTIEWHRVSLGSKLGAANRVELARIASTAGLQFFDDEMFAKICKLSAAEQVVRLF